MREVISPNVTKIFPDNFGYSRKFQSAKEITLHQNGVIVIDLIDKDSSQGYKDEISLYAIDLFKKYEESGHLYPVSVTGLKTDDGLIGSHRFCNWMPNLAKRLTDIIKDAGLLEKVYTSDVGKLNSGELQFEEVSKYFRFMRYTSGGEHYPHYDSDFAVECQRTHLGIVDTMSTKYSMVMYFTDNETGEIAFVNNPNGDEDKSDWTRQANDDEIWLKIKPRVGRIVLFPHTLCHTVLPYTDGEVRIIARGDLIFSV